MHGPFSPPIAPIGQGTLYTSPTPRSQRLMFALYGLVGVLLLVMLGLVVLIVVIGYVRSIPGISAAGLLIGIPWLVCVATLVVTLVMQAQMVFSVTTKGITLTPPYRGPRTVPWAEISRIEPSASWLMRGATVVVLQDGTRLTASQTNASAAFLHPPAPPHLGPDNGAPTPLRAALDGLERYRRGEFSGAGVTAPHPPGASNGPSAPPPSW